MEKKGNSWDCSFLKWKDKRSLLLLQIAEGILPHRSALGFPGLAGGFTFTIYGLF